MKQKIKKLTAVLCGLALCLPAAAWAEQPGDPCSGAPDRVRSVVCLSDGNFSNPGNSFADGALPSGFHEITYTKLNGVDYPASLTYPAKVGGKRQGDHSVRLTAYSGDAKLKVGEGTAYYAVGKDEVFVIDANVLIPDQVKDHSVDMQFGNTYTFGASVMFKTNGQVTGRYYQVADGTTQTIEQVLWESYELNKWYRVKMVYERAKDQLHVFLNGARAGTFPVRENNANLTSVTFVQKSPGSNYNASSFYIDDIEIYIAQSLDTAFDMSRAVTDIQPIGEVCQVDQENHTITAASRNNIFTLTDLEEALLLPGGVASILRSGALASGNLLQDGDTVVTWSQDHRTYRYDTLRLSYPAPENLCKNGELISADPQTGADSSRAGYMFDDDISTYLSAYSGASTGTFVLDLKESRQFDTISMDKPDKTLRQFYLTVEVSDNNADWQKAMANALVPSRSGEEILWRIPRTSGRYVRFTVHDIIGSNMGFAVSELRLYDMGQRTEANLCKNVPVVDANPTAGNPKGADPLLAVDGNLSTYFVTYSGVHTGYFILDLGTKQSFNKMVFYKPSDTLRTFDLTVETSDDNLSYHPVVKAENTTGKADTAFSYSFETASGRYVKVAIDNIQNTGGAFSISEFQLFLETENQYSCQFEKQEDGSLKVQVLAATDPVSSVRGILTAGIYDGDKMIASQVLDPMFALNAGRQTEKTYQLSLPQGAKEVRIYLWDSWDKMRPLSAIEEYTL